MDLDAALREMALLPEPEQWREMEAAVFARMRRDEARGRMQLGTATAAVALMMGVAGAAMPSRGEAAPLLPQAATLAPSTLLTGS